jgi:hypothetical protein
VAVKTLGSTGALTVISLVLVIAWIVVPLLISIKLFDRQNV